MEKDMNLEMYLERSSLRLSYQRRSSSLFTKWSNIVLLRVWLLPLLSKIQSWKLMTFLRKNHIIFLCQHFVRHFLKNDCWEIHLEWTGQKFWMKLFTPFISKNSMNETEWWRQQKSVFGPQNNQRAIANLMMPPMHNRVTSLVHV